MTFGSNDPSALRLEGLYVHADATVYLPQSWNPTDLRQRVYFCTNWNVPARCNAALDRQAFDLQLMWLREQGVEDPYNLIDTDELMISLLSRCRRTMVNVRHRKTTAIRSTGKDN